MTKSIIIALIFLIPVLLIIAIWCVVMLHKYQQLVIRLIMEGGHEPITAYLSLLSKHRALALCREGDKEIVKAAFEKANHYRLISIMVLVAILLFPKVFFWVKNGGLNI